MRATDPAVEELVELAESLHFPGVFLEFQGCLQAEGLEEQRFNQGSCFTGWALE